MRIFTLSILLSFFFFFSCKKENNSNQTEPIKTQEAQPEAISLMGQPFYEPERSPETQSKLEANLEDAKKTFNDNPHDEMSIIWYGRRMAYLSRYQKAVDIYTEGLKEFPESYKLYRHRGHRYVSMRKFDKAIEDFNKAAELSPAEPLEIEPDGIPNKLNKPLSSTQFNIWYHLALAHYLKGDFEAAEKAYQRCMETSVNDDLICATVDWYYMTLRRMGKVEEAENVLEKIHDDMEIIENDSYFKRLQMYQGKLSPEDVLNVSDANADKDLALATQGYGVGNWYLVNGDTAKAKEIFQQVIDGKHWSAFGYIAAEADLARMGE